MGDCMKEKLRTISRTLFKEGNFTKEDIPAFFSGLLWGFLIGIVLWFLDVYNFY